jgi:hypothetical protein
VLATLVSLILTFVDTPQAAAPELNRVNDNQYVGNLSSPFLGQATRRRRPGGYSFLSASGTG